MNETIRTILERRSIRTYKTDIPDEKIVGQILEAGRYAPSAMNQQSWHFTVIRDRTLLEALDIACKKVFLESDVEALREVAARPDFSVFYQAPVLVIVSGDNTALAPRYDCTLAMENMLLAAASLDISSCWMHSIMMLYSTEKGKAVFRDLGITFPERHEPYAAAVFGYSAVALPDAEPRKEGDVTFIG